MGWGKIGIHGNRTEVKYSAKKVEITFFFGGGALLVDLSKAEFAMQLKLPLIIVWSSWKYSNSSSCLE